MIYKHVLQGCSPTPLASYLKALGILRLVSEQMDPACRAAWIDDRFVLATTLSREALEKFFLEAYAPTPIIDPWNGGSGFYPKDNKRGISTLLRAEDARLTPIQDAIRWALQATDGLSASPSDKLKAAFQSRCVQELRGPAALAVQAAFVLSPKRTGGGRDLDAAYPSLLGTGWNDGRLDFANNFHQRIAEIFGLLLTPSKNQSLDQERDAHAKKMQDRLSLTLWRYSSPGLDDNAIGQFFPDAAGGANSTTGAMGKSLVNPWDFVLMLEGAILFSASASKKTNAKGQVKASAPFALHNHATGVGSISASEESTRGEQWMPLWRSFSACPEIKNLLCDGRAQLGKRTAGRPIDMARAIARLGVSRGISSFVRYGYLERNGQANFAVPLGRVLVVAKPHVRLVDDIAPWMDRLHREARSRTASARIVTVEQRLADAVFEALTHDESPSRWQSILMAAVAVERLQAAGSARGLGPIPRLSPEWVTACDDNTPEHRLAVALGSAAARYTAGGYAVDRLRHHFLPLERLGKEENGRDVRVVAFGRDPISDLIAILDRRVIESADRQGRHPQIKAAPGAGAGLGDLAAWVDGRVDPVRCVNLARAYMAVAWGEWRPSTADGAPRFSSDVLPDAWCVLRLNTLAWPLSGEHDIPCDPALVRRLQAGQGADAVRIALRRLHAHGIRPALRYAISDRDTARRFGAALTFPIHRDSAARLLRQIQP